MAQIVKPKLTNVGDRVKLKNYNFNQRTDKEEHIDLISYVDDSLKELFSGIKTNFEETVIDPLLDDPLKDGTVQSFFEQFHIFDYDLMEEETPSDAEPDSPTTPSEETSNSSNDNINNKSVEELAQEVLDGKYGSGEERRKALGDRYDEVQAKVNEMLYGNSSSETNEQPKPSSDKPSNDEQSQDVPSNNSSSGDGLPENWKSPYPTHWKTGKNTTTAQKEVYSYLKNEMGLNDAAIAGIMANVEAEGAFDPLDSSMDVNGYRSNGLFCWNEGAYPAWAYGTTVNSQMNYMAKTIKSSTLEKIKALPNTEEGARQAAYIFAKEYEVCSSSDYNRRRNFASTFYNSIT